MEESALDQAVMDTMVYANAILRAFISANNCFMFLQQRVSAIAGVKEAPVLVCSEPCLEQCYLLVLALFLEHATAWAFLPSQERPAFITVRR